MRQPAEPLSPSEYPDGVSRMIIDEWVCGDFAPSSRLPTLPVGRAPCGNGSLSRASPPKQCAACLIVVHGASSRPLANTRQLLRDQNSFRTDKLVHGLTRLRRGAVGGAPSLVHCTALSSDRHHRSEPCVQPKPYHQHAGRRDPCLYGRFTRNMALARLHSVGPSMLPLALRCSRRHVYPRPAQRVPTLRISRSSTDLGFLSLRELRSTSAAFRFADFGDAIKGICTPVLSLSQRLVANNKVPPRNISKRDIHANDGRYYH